MAVEDTQLEQLRGAGRRINRLLSDDAVVLHPGAGRIVHGDDDDSPVTAALVWRLDPEPVRVDGRQWAELELGLAQRAELLHAIHTDLYGPRTLLAAGVLPAEVIYGDPDYLRALIGVDQLALFSAAFDLGHHETDGWQIVRQHCRAPVGLGYAMENRRVLARAIPDQYAETDLVRLTGFYQAMRIALAQAAPSQREDPRVVVLSPGSHATTAFDHAVLAAQLGFPLVEGSDLVVNDGRVWLRGVDQAEPVDVIFRHVRSSTMDPLELRSPLRHGAAGLTEAVRRNQVAVVNGLGSGILDSPILQVFEAELCAELLGEPLRLRSVPTRWCGTDEGLAAALHDDALSGEAARIVAVHEGIEVPTDPDELRAAVTAQPRNYCVRTQPRWLSSPTLDGNEAHDRPVLIRSFAARIGDAYQVMPGGLGLVVDDEAHTDPGTLRGQVSKDVWVVDPLANAAALTSTAVTPLLSQHRWAEPAVMVPRALDDLHWFGRYAERAEALVRLVLATRQVAVETGDSPGNRALAQLISAVSKVAATAPPLAGDDIFADLQAVVTDWNRRGSVARSLARLIRAGEGVRDQLSADVWMVLASVERGMAELRDASRHTGATATTIGAATISAALLSAGEKVLAGLLALTGITAENMVRDPGWFLLDAGRGVERALQLTALLRHGCAAPTANDPLVVDAVLVAAESVVTFRRRHGGQARLGAVMDLLVADSGNPRSVAFQLLRVGVDLRQVPGTTHTSRPLRLIDDLLADIEQARVRDMAPDELTGWLTDTHHRLRTLAESINQTYLTRPPAPQTQQLTRALARPGSWPVDPGNRR